MLRQSDGRLQTLVEYRWQGTDPASSSTSPDVVATLASRFSSLFPAQRPVPVFIVTPTAAYQVVTPPTTFDRSQLLFLSQDQGRDDLDGRDGMGVWRLYRYTWWWARSSAGVASPAGADDGREDVRVLDEYDPVQRRSPAMRDPTAARLRVLDVLDRLLSTSSRRRRRVVLLVTSRPCPQLHPDHVHESATYVLKLAEHIYIHAPQAGHSEIHEPLDDFALQASPIELRRQLGCELLSNGRLGYIPFMAGDAAEEIQTVQPCLPRRRRRTDVARFSWAMERLHARHQEVLTRALQMELALGRRRDPATSPGPSSGGAGRREEVAVDGAITRDMVWSLYAEAVALLVLFRWASSTKFHRIVMDEISDRGTS